jgi:hypothetical protein
MGVAGFLVNYFKQGPLLGTCGSHSLPSCTPMYRHLRRSIKIMSSASRDLTHHPFTTILYRSCQFNYLQYPRMVHPLGLFLPSCSCGNSCQHFSPALIASWRLLGAPFLSCTGNKCLRDHPFNHSRDRHSIGNTGARQPSAWTPAAIHRNEQTGPRPAAIPS